jgi:hypothetical protein
VFACKQGEELDKQRITLREKPSPDFSGEGVISYTAWLLFLTAFHAASLFAFAARPVRRRRCRRRPDQSRQANNQKKIFHINSPVLISLENFGHATNRVPNLV